MQAAYAAPSSLHWNVTGDSVSVNEKLAVGWFVGFAGNAVIDGAGGGVRSTVHAKLVPEPTFPAASFASTVNVCEPPESPA